MKKYKRNSLQDLIQNYPDHIIAIRAGCFYNLYYESARIVSEIFGYKTYENRHKNFSRIATGFPEESLGMIVDELRLRNIKFVIVKDYEIIEINSEGEGINDDFENVYYEVPSKQELKYLVVDINSGIIDKIDANSIFGYYFVNKKIGDFVTFISPNNELIELKIKNIIS